MTASAPEAVTTAIRPPDERFPGRYLNITSFKRDGTGVDTPVWFVADGARCSRATRSPPPVAPDPTSLVTTSSWRNSTMTAPQSCRAAEVAASVRRRASSLPLSYAGSRCSSAAESERGSLTFIEDFIRRGVLPLDANTHRGASATGLDPGAG